MSIVFIYLNFDCSFNPNSLRSSSLSMREQHVLERKKKFLVRFELTYHILLLGIFKSFIWMTAILLPLYPSSKGNCAGKPDFPETKKEIQVQTLIRCKLLVRFELTYHILPLGIFKGLIWMMAIRLLLYPSSKGNWDEKNRFPWGKKENVRIESVYKSYLNECNIIALVPGGKIS